jgi:hypothetical protein
MLPVSYENDCRRCHALTFDLFDLFPPGTEAPHGRDPRETTAWLRARFRGLLADSPDLWKRPLVLPPEPDRRLPPGIWRETTPEPPRSAEEWVERRANEASVLLVRRSCQLCHHLSTAAENVEIEEPAIPDRWLRRAEFQHEPHRFFVCAGCHAAAARSQETSDILIPAMETCLSCHRGERPGSARSTCVTCHVYHGEGSSLDRGIVRALARHDEPWSP